MPIPKRKTSDPIELDGRTLEGGGQLIRNTLCLSALTGIPVKIHDIRGNRSSGGGLKAQHLACVKWLAQACGARIEGAELKSKTLVFEPGQAGVGAIDAGLSPVFKKVARDGEAAYECRIDIGTAGSTGLALQAILPFILFSELPSRIPIRLKLSGGTNVSGSPSYDYISQVLLPTLRAIGFPEITATLEKRGWSQGGGASIGSFTLEIPPRATPTLPAFTLKPNVDDENVRQQKPTHLRATFSAPQSCHDHFRNVLLPAVKHNFGDNFSPENSNLQITCENSQHDKRMYLLLVATILIPSNDATNVSTAQTYTLARDWLYERKIRSHERAATEMAEAVTRALADEIESGALVDSHMRDQLVIFQALARGTSEVYPGVNEDEELVEPTLHARTAEWVAKQMLGVKFDVEGRCEGVGFGAEQLDCEIAGEQDVKDGLEQLRIA